MDAIKCRGHKACAWLMLYWGQLWFLCAVSLKWDLFILCSVLWLRSSSSDKRMTSLNVPSYGKQVRNESSLDKKKIKKAALAELVTVALTFHIVYSVKLMFSFAFHALCWDFSWANVWRFVFRTPFLCHGVYYDEWYRILFKRSCLKSMAQVHVAHVNFHFAS